MTAWDEIRCQRGCRHHAKRVIDVDLAVPHRYPDHPQVPADLARSWRMFVWDTDVQPVDGGPYCPARDAVSETIRSHRIWEPSETIMALHAFRGAPAGSLFLDLGAQIGWFSLLAASCGMPVVAVDADPENLSLLHASMAENWWTNFTTANGRIGRDASVSTLVGQTLIRLAKIDVEGAEPEAVNDLWLSIEAGRVDHLLIEVSPVFHDRYPALVRRLVDAGYDAFVLPPKHVPPFPLDDPEQIEAGLLPSDDSLEEIVAGWHQEDVWLKRQDVAW